LIIYKNMNSFISNTAKDYDIDYETVERYYNWYFEEGTFYEKLEEFIKNRISC